MSETEELLKERIFSLQRHKEEAEQVKYELQVSLQRLAAENVRLKDRLAGCREGEMRTSWLSSAVLENATSAEEAKLHRTVCAKEDEISSLQKHVSELASVNARIQRKTALSSGEMLAGSAVTNLKRLMADWFYDFRKQTSAHHADPNATTSHSKSISYLQALIAALLSVLQVAQKDVEDMSPPLPYTELLRRAIYAAQLEVPGKTAYTTADENIGSATLGPSIPPAAAAAASLLPSESGSAGRSSDPSDDTPWEKTARKTSTAPPPLLQALGDRPLPRREDGADSLWDFLFGGGSGGFAVSGINNSESTHVLPV